MPSTYSTRARFTLQATGENFNTWGVILNAQDIQLIDDAIAGLVALTLSGSHTLIANQGASDEARMAAINITGGSGGTLVIPAVSKTYIVRNGAVGNVSLNPTGTSNNAIVYPGETVQIATDGASVWRVHAANFDGQTLSNLGAPANPNDAATKTYVDTAVAGVVVGPFPPMAGQQGKFISTTDGLTPSWQTSSALTWQLGGVKLGGATNAFPYLKQVGATVAHRLADDSGDALTTAASPPAGDNSLNLATTAWVRQNGLFMGGPYGISGSSTLTASAAGSLQVVNATGITVTLPLLSTVTPGATIKFISNGASNLLKPQGSDSLFMNNATYNAGFGFGVGDFFEITANTSASNWIVTSNSVGLFGVAGMQSSQFTTAPQFDNQGRLATDQFVQRALGNRSNNLVVSGANTTLTPAQCGQYIIIAGSTTQTLTLPLAASCVPGASFCIQNSTSLAWTLARQGSDTIFTGQAFSTSIAIEGNGGWLTLFANPSNNAWYAHGTSMMGNTGWFTHGNGTTGFQQLPQGSFMNWCVVTSSATAGATAVFNWPTAFPTNYGALWLTGWTSGASPMANCHGYNTSRTQFQGVCILASTQFSAFSVGY